MDKNPEKKMDSEKLALKANENLLSSKAYILFTVDDEKGNNSFCCNHSKLSDLEELGFLTVAINSLTNIKARLEAMTEFCTDCDVCDHKDDCGEEQK